MKKLKKKYFYLIFSILFVFLFLGIVGVSYSYLTTTAKGKQYVMYTGNLEVEYKKKTDTIHMENAYPMTNQQGLETTPYEFTVTNTGNVTAKYQIRLELDETVKDQVPLNNIKMSFEKDNQGYSDSFLLSNLETNLVFTKNILIKPEESHTYGMKLWIDINAGNEIQGKTFSAQVVVDSIQELADNYEVDTRPILTLKEGTSNISLRVNDDYQDLGVEKIEDDQEIFTSSDVVTTIEYFDGTNEELQTVEEVDTTQTGVYYITYQVTDRSGNIGQVVRVVTVNETLTRPNISLKGNEEETIYQYSTYIDSGVNIEEKSQLITIGEVKTSVPGTYTVRYIVVGQNNQMNSITRTVIVIPPYQEELLNGAYPILTDNLIPVMIEDDGTVKKANIYEPWYSYREKRWANAVVVKDKNKEYEIGKEIPESEIESYFVWIPKYKYKLFDMGEYSNITSFQETTPPTIEVQFGLTNTSNSNSGECTTPGVAGEKGSCKLNDYMTHPAFLAFDSNGFWVGKFETGYEGATTKEEAQVNSSEPDKIIIKPNVYSWRNITVGNAFQASYEYLRKEESHMMKNTEWGAVAYLQHSKYGSQESVRVNNNSAYITGYASTVEPTKGYSSSSIDGNQYEAINPGQDGTYTVNYLNNQSNIASTTGNRSGIYDMSGGGWEYVMGYTTGATNKYGNSGFTDETFPKDNKYVDFYTSDNSFQNRILGDATGEMGPFGEKEDPDHSRRPKGSWYGDYAGFVNSSYPWFYRGGLWYNGSAAGVFAFTNGDASGVNSDISFRLVLTP